MRNLVIILSCVLLILPVSGCGKDELIDTTSQAPDDIVVQSGVEFEGGDGCILTMTILMSAQTTQEPMPAIVGIHGGSWESGTDKDMLHLLYGFAQSGYVCASINYRLSSEAVFPAQIEDCKAAVRFLRAHAEDYHIDTARIGTWGASAGGHLSALMGASNGAKELEGNGGYQQYDSDVQAACNWYGPVDFRSSILDSEVNVSRMLGGPPQQNAQLAAMASPIVYISPESAPSLFMMGDKDEYYNYVFDTAKQFCKDMNELGIYAAAEVVRGEGHKFTYMREYYRVKAFFDEHLMNVQEGGE